MQQCLTIKTLLLKCTRIISLSSTLIKHFQACHELCDSVGSTVATGSNPRLDRAVVNLTLSSRVLALVKLNNWYRAKSFHTIVVKPTNAG